MAFLKDLIVTGAARIIGKLTANSIQTDKINVPTSSNGSTFGVGSNGNVLKSNGTTVYWGADTNDNTTYTLTQDATDKHKLTFTPSTGTATTITIPDNNTTYTFATGDANGQIKVTPAGGSATNVSVKGLGSNAYTSTSYEPIANVTSKGSSTQPVYFDANGVAQNTTYKLEASVPSNAKFTDTVTTATNSGTGNIVTGVTANNGALTISKGDINHNQLVPIMSKTYTGLVCSSNTNGAGADFMPISLTPVNADDTWSIRFRLYSTYKRSNDNITYSSLTYGMLTGVGNATPNSFMWNSYKNSSYRAHYYVVQYRPTSATAAHRLGFSLYNTNNNTSSTNPRTVTIDIIEYNNCTVSLADTCANTDYTTYYVNMTARSTYDACNAGLQETGDNNTYDRTYLNAGYMKNNATFRLAPYTVFGLDRDFKTQGISLYSSEYTGNTQSMNTARVYNTNGIDYTKKLWYLSASTNYNVNTNVDTTFYFVMSALDFRYTDNVTYAYNGSNFAMRTREPVFFRGVIKEDGLFYLRPYPATQVITQGYYKNSTTFVTASGGSTNISNYTPVNTSCVYQDITSKKYYTWSGSAYTEVTSWSNKPAYQKVWTQDIPTSVEKDADGYQYVYWQIGIPYYSSNYRDGAYQIDLYHDNEMFWYHKGAFRKYEVGDSVVVIDNEEDITSHTKLFIDTEDTSYVTVPTMGEFNSLSGRVTNLDSRVTNLEENGGGGNGNVIQIAHWDMMEDEYYADVSVGDLNAYVNEDNENPPALIIDGYPVYFIEGGAYYVTFRQEAYGGIADFKFTGDAGSVVQTTWREKDDDTSPIKTVDLNGQQVNASTIIENDEYTEGLYNFVNGDIIVHAINNGEEHSYVLTGLVSLRYGNMYFADSFYEFMDYSDGVFETYHSLEELWESTLGEGGGGGGASSDIIIVDDANKITNETKLFVDTNAQDVDIPTMEDHNALAARVTTLENNSGGSSSSYEVTTNKVSSITEADKASTTKYTSVKAVYDGLAGKSNTGHKHTKADITDFPTIPAAYNDSAISARIKTLEDLNISSRLTELEISLDGVAELLGGGF